MGPILTRCIGFAATALGALILLVAPAIAQPGPAAPAPAANDPGRNSPAHTLSLAVTMIVRPDLTATISSTTRVKILRESAIRAQGQQTLPYAESLNLLEVVEAYTEKTDGRKLPVDPTTILTRDAATGLNAVYQRDAKVKTLIFPDIELGDTLVYRTRIDRIDRRFPGHFSFHAVFPRSIPYDTYRMTVEEPNGLWLRVHLKGDGVTHETTKAGEGRRHLFSFRPTGWAPEEPGAVSILDRDPQIMIT